MPTIFQKIDKIRPAYGIIYRAVLFLRKLFLIVGTLITIIAVTGRYTPLIPDPAWSEEVVLTCVSYMAAPSAALAIRRGAHTHITVFGRYLPPKLVKNLDTVTDLAVLAPAAIMITVGWEYVTGTEAKDTYVSMPRVSRLWMYLPVPPTGVAMLVFEVETLCNHAKNFFVKEGME